MLPLKKKSTYKLNAVVYEGCLEIETFTLIVLGEKIWTLKYHQNINQDRVYQREKFLVHGMIRSFLSGNLTNLPSSSDPKQPKLKLLQHHFNTFHCFSVSF